MTADFNAKLTNLAAGILRDAAQAYGPSGTERLLAGFSPVLMTGSTGVFPVLDATGSLPSLTGSLRALAMTGPHPAPPPATGTFAALTGSFRALTSSFSAVGQPPAEPVVTLRRVFGLPGRLPGVRLPAEAELAVLARSAPSMAALDTLARWLGPEGRVLSRAENLTSADAAQAASRLGIEPDSVPALWDHALATGWFQVVDGTGRKPARAVIGKTAWHWANGDDQGALHVWATVFAAVAARVLDIAASSDTAGARRLNFQGQGVAVAVHLFLTRRAGMTLREVEVVVREGAIGEHPSSRLKRAWAAWVRRHGEPAHYLLSQLTAVGAVTVADAPDGKVELTPLALWALREQFRLDRIAVPVLAPPSPPMSPADLVALREAVSEAEFDAGFAAWMDGRDPDQAVRGLLTYATASDPQGRLTALDIARRAGTGAHQAWRDAMRHTELRGHAELALALMAAELREAGLPPAPELDPEDQAWAAVDQLAAAWADDAPDPDQIASRFAEAVLARQPGLPPGPALALMARSAHPDAARVLAGLAEYHPSRRVARAARKAARDNARSLGAMASRPARAGASRART